MIVFLPQRVLNAKPLEGANKGKLEMDVWPWKRVDVWPWMGVDVVGITHHNMDCREWSFRNIFRAIFCNLWGHEFPPLWLLPIRI